MADDLVGLAQPPRTVASLILRGGVPPTVVEHDMVGRGEVQPRTASLERQDERARALTLLELTDHPVAHGCGKPAVVAGHRDAEPAGEVRGQLVAPRREVGEDE